MTHSYTLHEDILSGFAPETPDRYRQRPPCCAANFIHRLYQHENPRNSYLCSLFVVRYSKCARETVFFDLQADLRKLEEVSRCSRRHQWKRLVVSTRDGCSKEECHHCCLLMTAAIAHLFKGWHPGGTSDVKWISIELVCDAYVVQKCCLFFPKKIQHVSQELSSTSVDRNFWKTSCLIQQANFITEKWITCLVNSWSFNSRESSLFLIN